MKLLTRTTLAIVGVLAVGTVIPTVHSVLDGQAPNPPVVVDGQQTVESAGTDATNCLLTDTGPLVITCGTTDSGPSVTAVAVDCGTPASTDAIVSDHTGGADTHWAPVRDPDGTVIASFRGGATVNVHTRAGDQVVVSDTAGTCGLMAATDLTFHGP